MADEEKEIIEPERDLEKERDERCIPVVRGMLNDMAIDLIPQNGEEVNPGPLVMKMLKRSLDADLNLTTENSYLFQLMLGLIGGLNTAMLECATVPIDDVRYSRIAKQILEIVTTSDISLGNIAPEQVVKEFVPVQERLNVLFASEKLNWLEIKYIMDSVLTAFKNVELIFSTNVDRSLQRAESKAMGVESVSDITMGQLNGFLIAPEETV